MHVTLCFLQNLRLGLNHDVTVVFDVRMERAYPQDT